MEQVAFIICYNERTYLSECLWYIERLNVPKEFTTDVITIGDAPSMCAGYNAAMHESSARYKVYLHQDTFILNRNFISDMVKAFGKNEAVGLMGVVGGENLPKDGNCIDGAWSVGKLYYGTDQGTVVFCNREPQDINYVSAVDGLIMMTDRDIEWREDLYDGFDFYDISQSIEFIKNGYRIAVPAQGKNPWVLHDDGGLGLDNYDHYRKIFCEDNSGLFHYEDNPDRIVYLKKKHEADPVIKKTLAFCREKMDAGETDEALMMAFRTKPIAAYNNELRMLTEIAEITSAEHGENMECLVEDGMGYDGVMEKYKKLRFLIISTLFTDDEERKKQVSQMIEQERLSEIAADYITLRVRP